MSLDVAIIGSGPNGLSAGIVLAAAGLSVSVFESHPTPGGGTRTAELTLPGFLHDVCSAIHPLAVASPFLSGLQLEKHGLQWIRPPVAVVHLFDDGSGIPLEPSVQATAALLGPDRDLYHRWIAPLVESHVELLRDALGPLRWPRRTGLMARFGIPGLLPATAASRWCLRSPQAQALLAGMAAHANLPLEKAGTTAVGALLLVLGHAAGWPLARGGSAQLAQAMVRRFESYGGKLVTNHEVDSTNLPEARVRVFDVGARQLTRLLANQLPDRAQRQLRSFTYGAGIYKMDWALSAPIPWTCDAARRSATLHLGGDWRSIATYERSISQGQVQASPFLIIAQPSVFDPTRAPQNQHVAWAYCHVPAGYTGSVTNEIEARIENVAPGFRDCILARSVMRPGDLENYNPNYVGGDISGGQMTVGQLWRRPLSLFSPYRLPVPGQYICSASSPPGPGVHGMCGYYAATCILDDLGVRNPFPL